MKEISGLRIYITSTNSMQLIAKRFYWCIKKRWFFIFLWADLLCKHYTFVASHTCAVSRSSNENFKIPKFQNV